MTMEEPGLWDRLFADLSSCSPGGLLLAMVAAAGLTFSAWAKSGSASKNPLAFLVCWLGGLVWIFGFEFKRWGDQTFWVGLGLVMGPIAFWHRDSPDGPSPPPPPRRDDAAGGPG